MSMRVVVDSKRVLVIECPGRLVQVCFFTVVALHAASLFFVLDLARPVQTVATAFISIVAYTIGTHLVLGAFADKIVVTIHASKRRVTVERVFPFGKKRGWGIDFDAFERFEFSAPMDRGFCRVRLKNGKTRELFRIGMRDDYEVLKHLDMITRKPLEIVH